MLPYTEKKRLKDNENETQLPLGVLESQSASPRLLFRGAVYCYTLHRARRNPRLLVPECGSAHPSSLALWDSGLAAGFPDFLVSYFDALCLGVYFLHLSVSVNFLVFLFCVCLTASICIRILSCFLCWPAVSQFSKLHTKNTNISKTEKQEWKAN